MQVLAKSLLTFSFVGTTWKLKSAEIPKLFRFFFLIIIGGGEGEKLLLHRH